jgi:DNA-binding NarL/FixJ family response regulator
VNHDGEVRAVASLRPYLDRCAQEIARCGFRLTFDRARDVAAAADRAAAVVLPATTPPETGMLRSVRAGNFLLPIVGVVCDGTGHQTYHALSAGATTVINLLLPAEHRMEALHAALGQRPRATPDPAGGPTPLRAVGTAVGGDAPGSPDHREVEVLVDLLCGPQTVSAIARLFFCSERSMYRRIRRLYDDIGVTGRAELRVAVALRDPEQARGA